MTLHQAPITARRSRRAAAAGMGAAATIVVHRTTRRRSETYGIPREVPPSRQARAVVEEPVLAVPVASTTEPQRSRWAVLVAYGLVAAATQALLVTYAPVTDDAARHFGVSVTTVGWLSQVFPLVYVLLAIPAGLLLDRFFRVSLVLGTVLTAAGAFLRLVADDFTWALIGQTVAAIGQPFVLNAIPGLAVLYLVKKDRTTGIALATAATFGGMVFGYALGACLPGEEHIRTLTLITALIAMDAGFCLLGALRLVAPLQAEDTAPVNGGLQAFRSAFGNRYLRRLCLVVAVPMGTFISLATFAQPLLAPAGVAASTTGWILAVTLVAGVVGCAVVPLWADRHHTEVKLMTAGVGFTAVACLHLAVVPSVAMAWLALLAIGFVLLPALPIVLALTERHAPDAEGTAAGLIWLAGNLGGVVLATAVGLLVLQPTLAFAVLAAATALALPALRWFGRLDQEEQDADVAMTAAAVSG